MATVRTSNSFHTHTSAGSNSYTLAAYDPGYSGAERGRIVFIPYYAKSNGGGSLANVILMTYGGKTMTQIARTVQAGAFISAGIAYIINPPTGAQDIVFTVAGLNWVLNFETVAFGNNLDSGFRVGQTTRNATDSASSLSTTYTTTTQASWGLAFTAALAQNQTLTTGTFLDGDANPGKFMVVDTGAEIGDGTSFGVACTVGVADAIIQGVVTFLPIRRGMFYFFV